MTEIQELARFTIVGIVIGSIYAIAASGLVVTYTTSGIFNFAHGAIGMVMAFAYWELSVNQGWPSWLALAVVLLVLSPLLGVLLERALFRRLHDAAVGVTLVVTVGLLVLLLGVGQTMWPGTEQRVLSDFFVGNTVTVAGIVVSYHELTVLAVAAAVAFGLRLLLFRTRVGVAMRAVVDNRELAAQNGAVPEAVAALAWVLGTVLAAVAGILLAPSLSLQHVGLTLLVINGYAAAMLGRLRSLPLTFGGAMILGILQAYLIGYGGRWRFGAGILGNNHVFAELTPVIPVLMLFAILVFLPQARLQAGRIVGAASPRVPGLVESLRAGALFLAVAVGASFVLSDVRLFDLTTGLVLGMVMLTLVLLSGYGGQVSLCQFAFVGVGAFVMGGFFESGNVLGMMVAGVVTAVVGALVAMPALRLQDLYLALVTFSVALFAQEVVFDHPDTFDNGGNIFYDGLSLGPLDLSGDRAQFLVAATGFALFGVVVLAIRRGPFGRRLAAMSDSPAACATLGMSLLGTKVSVFAVSAGMAGMAGALYGSVRGSAGAIDFNVVQSLFVFLLATIGGITTVTGAFIGGVVFAFLPVVQSEWVPSLELQGLFIGVGAIVVSRYPNGFAGVFYAWLAGWRRRWQEREVEGELEPASAPDPGLAGAPSASAAPM